MSWFDIIYQDPIPFGSEYPVFNRVSIETSTMCNRHCSFCPISRSPRKQSYISDALYTKICDELHALKFDGCIELFLLNEPLYDRHYLRRIQELREACPKVTIYCSTNGDAILRTDHVTLEQLQEAGLNVLCFAIYDEGKDNEALARKEINRAVCKHRFEWTEHRYRKHSRMKLFLSIQDMRQTRAPQPLTASWSERGMKSTEAKSAYCPRPMRHIVVETDGRVPICCAVDPLDRSLPSFGNINECSLVEAWNSQTAFEYRCHLQNRQRDLPGCKYCNAKVAYPHVVRKVVC